MGFGSFHKRPSHRCRETFGGNHNLQKFGDNISVKF